MIHSIGKTKKYEFDCQKKIHLKIATEKDGTEDIRIIGEREGHCERIVLGVWADTVNLALKRQLTIEDVLDICKGHICQNCFIGFKSCVDDMVRDYKTSKEKKEKTND